MPSGVTIAAAIGLVLSVYAVYVEHMFHTTDGDFVALCDIEAIQASCSQVFNLPQGRMLSYFGLVPKGSVLDVPNALLGSLHYFYLLVLEPHSPPPLTSIAVAAAFWSTVFLAYQLTFVVFELCIVCWSTHVINTYVMYKTFFGASSGGSGKEKVL